MNYLLKIATGTFLTLCIGQPLLANESASHPLVGKWISNKEASLQELNKAGLASQEINKLSFLFGKMVVVIKNDTYTTILNEQVNETPYSIISTSNGCFKVKFEQDISELCIKNNMLYVPSYKGSKEVFNKI